MRGRSNQGESALDCLFDGDGPDEMTRKRRRALVSMQRMSTEALFRLAVRAGIYTEKGKLTKSYREDADPSALGSSKE